MERPLQAGRRPTTCAPLYDAPEDVEKQPATEFRLLQDNADKFQHNKDRTDRRIKAVEDAGLSEHQRMRRGASTLPAPQGSGNAAGRLTRRGRPAVVRQLDDFLGPRRPRSDSGR